MSRNGRPHVYRSLAGRAGRPVMVLLVALTVAQVLTDLLPLLLRNDLYVGDAAQHTWWMYRFANANLFSHDLAAAYYAMPTFSPPGYQLLFRTLSHVLDIQHATEGAAVLLALASVGLVTYLGHVCSRKTGIAAALTLFLLTHAGRLAAGGLPRSFGLVLILAGYLALRKHRWGVLGLVLLASALLFPPVLFNLLPGTALILIVGIRRHGRVPRGFISFSVFSAVALIVLASIYMRSQPPGIGPRFSYEQVRAMPEWQPDGRSAFFLPWQEFYFQSSRSGMGLLPYQAASLAVLLLITAVFFREAIPYEAWLLLGGAFVMWALAHTTLFGLYLPGVYLTYALPAFGFVWAARGARELKLLLLERRGTAVRYLRRVAVVGAMIVAVMLLAADVKHTLADYGQPSKLHWARQPGYEDVLAFVSRQPVGTVVAAHPNDANAVPMRCHRSVLVNSETSVAFHVGYYGEMRRRLDATFDLLYATDWNTVDAIAEHEGVSYFLLDKTRLTRPDDRPYFEPFGTSNRARIEAGRGRFALLSPPAGRVMMRAADWVVLRVGKDAR